MSDFAIVARPYAQAVFELAKQNGDFSGWSALLETAASVVADEAVARLITQPAVAQQELAATVAGICESSLGNEGPLAGGANSYGRNLLKLLAENRRLASLPDIAARYELLRAEAQGQIDVTVTSASELDDGLRDRLSAALEKRLGRTVRLSCVVDENLIGGAQIRADDLVIDGAVSSNLARLTTALTN
jgi:F-type H+-transporting ATPase subunit delta